MAVGTAGAHRLPWIPVLYCVQMSYILKRSNHVIGSVKCETYFSILMTQLIDLVLIFLFFFSSYCVPVLLIIRHDGDIRNDNLPAFHSECLEEGFVFELLQVQRGPCSYSGKEDHLQVDVTREQFPATCKLVIFCIITPNYSVLCNYVCNFKCTVMVLLEFY